MSRICFAACVRIGAVRYSHLVMLGDSTDPKCGSTLASWTEATWPRIARRTTAATCFEKFVEAANQVVSRAPFFFVILVALACGR